MSSTVTIVRPTVNTFPIKEVASRWWDPVLLLSIRSFFSNFERIFFIFVLIWFNWTKSKWIRENNGRINYKSEGNPIFFFYCINADLKDTNYYVSSYELPQWCFTALLFYANLFIFIYFHLSNASVVVQQRIDSSRQMIRVPSTQ